MTLRARSLPFALAGLAILPTSGCELLDAFLSQEFTVPVDLETPPADVNVTEQVEGVEATFCEDPDSHDCLVVKALDMSDDDEVSDPPSIPPEFPVAVDIVNPETGQPETINVEEWAEDSGLAQEIDFKQVIPMDLSELVAVDDPAAIEELTVSNVVMNWIENSFTFDSTPMDLYVSSEFVDDPTADAQALIDDGTLEHVGTIPAQEAGVAGEAPVAFVEGGNQKFNDALKSMKFTILLAFPPDTPMGLPQGSEENLRIKPMGEAQVSLKATLEYKVNAAKLAEAAEGAAGAAE